VWFGSRYAKYYVLAESYELHERAFPVCSMSLPLSQQWPFLLSRSLNSTLTYSSVAIRACVPRNSGMFANHSSV